MRSEAWAALARAPEEERSAACALLFENTVRYEAGECRVSECSVSYALGLAHDRLKEVAQDGGAPPARCALARERSWQRGEPGSIADRAPSAADRAAMTREERARLFYSRFTHSSDEEDDSDGDGGAALPVKKAPPLRRETTEDRTLAMARKGYEAKLRAAKAAHEQQRPRDDAEEEGNSRAEAAAAAAPPHPSPRHPRSREERARLFASRF